MGNVVDPTSSNGDDRKRDLAARAAWLYYIGGRTQDEIAGQLNISRQAAQRLVALAVAEKLIKFRLDHRLSRGLELAAALRLRFALDLCEVAPADPNAPGPVAGIATTAAAVIESYLGRRDPVILAFSTGRTLLATALEVSVPANPEHRIVSVVGAMSRDGRASPYEVVMRLGARTGAQCFPMPTPVVADSVEERQLLQTQRSFATLSDLAHRAAASFFGLSQVGWGAPLHRDGFITDDEVRTMLDAGAVGEIAGWSFDVQGRLLEHGTNERVAGIPLARPARPCSVAVAGGPEKVNAIRAALRGRLISGLITDEATAEALLALG